MKGESRRPAKSKVASLLYANVLIVATCGLVYELLAGTLGSYLLGDSVTHFSLVIGLYLSAMGVGAWLSSFLKKNLSEHFVDVELGVALLGGFSVPMLFLSFAKLSTFRPLFFGTTFAIGIFVGLELPLLMRILREKVGFEKLIARALTFDYLGALFASLLFPVVLAPKLGLIRTAFLTGALNASVALWGTWVLPDIRQRARVGLRIRSVLVLGLLCLGFIKADSITLMAEQDVYANRIVFTKSTKFQRMVVTQNTAGFQLFLNGNLQFASEDEYRYHESLVHPAMLAAESNKRVMILGGGDGLALREVLRYPEVKEVVLVDLDPEMTRLGQEFEPLRELNENAFWDPRVRVVNDDAMVWLADAPPSLFDVAIVDFPDPSNFSVAKLYTTRFYLLLKARMDPNGAISIQSTSPLFARNSFWCIFETLKEAGFSTLPYTTSVPSFGVWGYVLAKMSDFSPPTGIMKGLRYLNEGALARLFVLPNDMGPVDVKPNRLNDQVLVRYYEGEWRKWD